MLPEPLGLLEATLRQIASEEILPRLQAVHVSHKADGSLLTEADPAVQQRLIAFLHEHDPAIPVLGEEQTEARQRQALDTRGEFWCVDPLDGTRNFASGFPVFSISLALIRDGRPALGLVYDPLREECFSAARGEGAWLNGRRLPVPPVVELRQALAMVDFKRLPRKLAQRIAAEPPFASQRSIGSVALDWCWLAAGRTQVYLHGKQHLWDYAAGVLILEEVGGQSQTLDGEPVFTPRLQPRSAVAGSSAAVFERWREWLGDW